MSRARTTVRALAVEVGLDCETTLLLLMDGGIFPSHELAHVPRSKVALARRILKLPSSHKLRSVSLDEIAESAGMGVVEARRKLLSKRVLRHPGQCRIPANRAAIAREALSAPLPQPPSDSTATLRKREKLRRRKSGQRNESWRTIGRPQDLIYLSVGDVEAIHWILVRDFKTSRDPIDPPGVRNKGLLESALFRPHTSLGDKGKYPTVAMAGAAVFHAIVHNHPFHNGNKRTALVAVVVFLDKNGFVLTAMDEELYSYVMAVASHEIMPGKQADHQASTDDELLAIATWLQSHMRLLAKGEYCMKFRELRKILSSHGCAFERLRDNSMKIMRGDLQTQVYYHSEGREVLHNMIHKIRHDLELDTEHGFDSDIFYNEGRKIADFIVKYRRPLDRLAKE